MNQQPLDAALRLITGKEQPGDVSIDQLEEIAEKYPYFPVAQFLLAKKMKDHGHEGAEKQAQKTALYFANPFWLHYQLAADQISEPIEIGNTQAIELEPEKFEDHPITSEFTIEEIEKADQKAHEDLGSEKIEPGTLKEELHPITQEFTIEEIEAASEKAHEDLGGSDLIEKEKQLEVEPIEDPETGQASMPDEHEQMFRNIKAMLESTTEASTSTSDKSGIPIDPYYTIDYFASQGIKLELEADPQDKLGKKLKKFTQWLKHMKKLGPEDAAESFEGGEPDEEVLQNADISNVTREIVTEAMAQVLEKQGKNEKAIQLYIKLSFLNPDKSIYFADKIKNLKGI